MPFRLRRPALAGCALPRRPSATDGSDVESNEPNQQNKDDDHDGIRSRSAPDRRVRAVGKGSTDESQEGDGANEHRQIDQYDRRGVPQPNPPWRRARPLAVGPAWVRHVGSHWISITGGRYPLGAHTDRREDKPGVYEGGSARNRWALGLMIALADRGRWSTPNLVPFACRFDHRAAVVVCWCRGSTVAWRRT